MDADAIVIGAGAAGLAAAQSLSARSLRVMIVEARDRVGGRVLSQPFGRAAVPAELGAEFIHGPAEETMSLLRDAGTAAIDSAGESWTCATAACNASPTTPRGARESSRGLARSRMTKASIDF